MPARLCVPSPSHTGARHAVDHWWPNGEMQDLPPLPGDSVSAATAIIDQGQVVGISGDCGFAIGEVSARHAVRWDDGVPTNLDDPGGPAWNTPTAINNDGVVIGFSLPLDQDSTRNYRAFVWMMRECLASAPGPCYGRVQAPRFRS